MSVLIYHFRWERSQKIRSFGLSIAKLWPQICKYAQIWAKLTKNGIFSPGSRQKILFFSLSSLLISVLKVPEEKLAVGNFWSWVLSGGSVTGSPLHFKSKWFGDPGTYIGSQIQSRRSSCPTLHGSHLETGFWRIWIRSRLIFPCKRFSWTEILSVENYMNAQSVLKCVAEWPDKSFLKWFTENLIALPSSLNGPKLFSKVSDMEKHLEGKGH